MKKNAKKCFISTSYSTSFSKLDSVVDIVEKMGMDPVTALQLSAGDSIVSTIADQIRSSDVVIVLFGDTENQQLYFELGMATALQKRIIVVYETKTQPTPSIGSGTVVLYIDNLEELNKLEWALEMVLSSPKKRKRKPLKNVESLSPLGPRTKEFLKRARIVEDHFSETRTIQLITDVLSSSGISTIVPSSRSDDGTDLTIWYDDKKTGSRIKLPIEVKKHISLDSARNAHSSMMGVDAPMSLVIYLTGSIPDSVQLFAFGRVLFIKLDDLIRSLETTTLPKLLGQYRNEIFHRKSP